MALLGSVHVGFVRSEENESQQTFHKALCYLCNRELKTTCSSMIACACGMNKRSVECECVCMQLMSDWSVDGMTAIVLHWLCATQVKKLTVLSYYKAHKYSSKLILHHPVSRVVQRVCVCAHVCVCVCVCARACVSEAAPYLWNARTVLRYFHFTFLTWLLLSCCSQKT